MVSSTSSSRGYRLKPGLATSAPRWNGSVITSTHINAVGAMMKVTVHLLPNRKETRTVEFDEGADVESLIRKLGLLTDSWIAIRGADPVPSDEPLLDGDEIKLISVVSGG